MKIYILIITIGLLSCNNQQKQLDNSSVNTLENKISKVDISKYITHLDTILIATEIGDTLKYTKTEFNKIVNTHPEFFEEYPANPDQTYSKDNDKEEFNSEFGQDAYFALYAYFLKQKNGVEKHAHQRRKLINIYSNINSMFRQFENGGTYFDHQKMRILGYAEYSIYLLPKAKKVISKTYSIKKQKANYIKSLQQLIEDENKIDFKTLGINKIKRIKKLNKIVDELDKLITDNFYLRRTQGFQYGHYEYY